MASLPNSTEEMPLQSVDVEKGIDQEGENGETRDLPAQTGVSYCRSIITAAILTFLNLVTVTSSFAVVGAMPYLRTAFKMDDSAIGFIDLAFIISSVLFGQVYGFLGDRVNRKYLVCIGMFFWSAINLSMSFIPNECFSVLLLISGLTGAAGASFSTTAPSIIADLFVGDKRSRVLSFYNLAGPVGFAVGYIIGSEVTSAAGDWRWAFRITPALGFIGVLLIVAFMKEPSRGAAEGNTSKPLSLKRWISDVNQLRKNPSFTLCTLGKTAVNFAAGAVGFWALDFLKRARGIINVSAACPMGICNYADSVIFGVLAAVSGILGVVTGTEIAKRYKKRNPRADPIVCGAGLLGSSIFLALAIFCANISLVATYIFTFIGNYLLTLNWSISSDIRLYVVSPTKRTTAEAVSSLVSQMLGYAVSASLIGWISKVIKSHNPDTALWSFRSLQCALFVCPIILLIGGACFLVSARFIEEDRKKAEMESEDHYSREKTDCVPSTNIQSSRMKTCQKKKRQIPGSVSALATDQTLRAETWLQSK